MALLRPPGFAGAKGRPLTAISLLAHDSIQTLFALDQTQLFEPELYLEAAGKLPDEKINLVFTALALAEVEALRKYIQAASGPADRREIEMLLRQLSETSTEFCI